MKNTGFYINVRFGQHWYRYFCEPAGDNFKVTGRNGFIIFTRGGELIKGSLQTYYFKEIYTTVMDKIKPVEIYRSRAEIKREEKVFRGLRNAKAHNS